MKKLLVMTAALALLAAPAFAGIATGPHDLSGKGIGTTEICVFCHTPHAADTNAGTTFPLSNRGAWNSTMCLTCHDGSVAYADMSNPPNGTVAGPDYNFATNGVISGANQHPVGVGATWTTDALPGGMTNVSPAPLTGQVSGTTVECSSCHDVHEPAFSPFLKVSNASSALCLDCHDK